MARLEDSTLIKSPFPISKLPLVSVNHISFAVPSPKQTAKFFEQVLGFSIITRPQAFKTSFDGAWVCGMGLEIHFIQPITPSPVNLNRNNDRLSNIMADIPIDPRNDHLSFLCSDQGPNSPWEQVIYMLEKAKTKYLERSFPQDDLRQVCSFSTCNSFFQSSFLYYFF